MCFSALKNFDDSLWYWANFSFVNGQILNKSSGHTAYNVQSWLNLSAWRPGGLWKNKTLRFYGKKWYYIRANLPIFNMACRYSKHVPINYAMVIIVHHFTWLFVLGKSTHFKKFWKMTKMEITIYLNKLKTGTSVSRFGKILPLWQKFKVFGENLRVCF